MKENFERKGEIEASCAGLHGPRGTWGVGRGRQGSNITDWRWRLTGVEVCSGGQDIQYRKRRGIIGCKKSGTAQNKGV